MMLTPKNTDQHPAGITLLELLVTFVIFAAIMSLLLTSFFEFHHRDKKLSAIMKAHQELRLLEKLIREDLQSAVYLEEFASSKAVPNGDARKSGIVATSDSVGDYARDRISLHVHRAARFFRRIPATKDPLLHEVSYYIEEDSSGKAKFKRREEYYLDEDMEEGDVGESITHSLSDRVVAFGLQFFLYGSDEPTDEWDSSATTAADKLPAGVEVTLTVRSEEGIEETSVMQVNLGYTLMRQVQ